MKAIAHSAGKESQKAKKDGFAQDPQQKTPWRRLQAEYFRVEQEKIQKLLVASRGEEASGSFAS